MKSNPSAPTFGQKITFGEVRAASATIVEVFSTDHQCSHSVELPADCRPNSFRLSDIEDRFVCRSCGCRGADVRPDYHLQPGPVGLRGWIYRGQLQTLSSSYREREHLGYAPVGSTFGLKRRHQA